METTKPFLVNTIRVPALPTLLLNSREIDTNANATRFFVFAYKISRLVVFVFLLRVKELYYLNHEERKELSKLVVRSRIYHFAFRSVHWSGLSSGHKHDVCPSFLADSASIRSEPEFVIDKQMMPMSVRLKLHEVLTFDLEKFGLKVIFRSLKD